MVFTVTKAILVDITAVPPNNPIPFLILGIKLVSTLDKISKGALFIVGITAKSLATLINALAVETAIFAETTNPPPNAFIPLVIPGMKVLNILFKFSKGGTFTIGTVLK